MKRVIRILLIIVAIYIGLVLLFTKVYASNGRLINDLVRLREKPSTNSEIVDLLSIGDKVEIVGTDGDWYKVKYKEGSTVLNGYLRKDMVEVDKSSEEDSKKNEKSENEVVENKVNEDNTTKENSKAPTPTKEDNIDVSNEINEIEENTKINLVNEIEIRILPLINSSKIGKLEAKTSAFVSEKIGNWCYIETEKLSGWVLASKLKLEKTAKQENNDSKKDEIKESEVKPASSTVNKKMYVSAIALNVRKEPKNNAEVIDQLLQNDVVTVVENVDNTWSKINIGGRTGYVATQFLSTKKSEVTSRGNDETRKAKISETEKVDKKSTKSETKKSITETENKTEAKTETKTETKKVVSSKGVTGEDVVAYAKQFLGCKYVYATAGPKTFDCSGFTTYVYKHFGYKLNRVANAQQKNGSPVKKGEWQPGDILCFNGHVGIYIGGGKFIHAENSRTGVVISSTSQNYYVRNYVTARRILK